MKKKIKNSRSAADFLRENFAELSTKKEFEPQLMKFATENFTVKETISGLKNLTDKNLPPLRPRGRSCACIAGTESNGFLITANAWTNIRPFCFGGSSLIWKCWKFPTRSRL